MNRLYFVFSSLARHVEASFERIQIILTSVAFTAFHVFLVTSRSLVSSNVGLSFVVKAKNGATSCQTLQCHKGVINQNDYEICLLVQTEQLWRVTGEKDQPCLCSVILPMLMQLLVMRWSDRQVIQSTRVMYKIAVSANTQPVKENVKMGRTK